MLRLVLSAILFLAPCLAQPVVEVGEIGGAAFRIDKPENWNGGLIMYCHGYSAKPGRFDAAKPDRVAAAFTPKGFAVAQSGYAGGGWAIEEAMRDTEALRHYFGKKYGAPKETYVTGHSMGGLLTAALVESNPSAYDGGLALCGALGPPYWGILRHYFDVRVVFDYYFPGALPPLTTAAPGYEGGPKVYGPLTKLLDEKPEAAAALRQYTGIRKNSELASFLAFNTGLLMELSQRAGGNPFDNRNTVYVNTGDDNSLNDKAARYIADPKAAAYLRRYYTTTGHLQRPLLAVHTTYDPIVPPWIPNHYEVLAESAGGAGFFVQQYVKHDGHCTISPVETEHAFDDLLEWKHSAKRPAAGERR